MVGTLDATSFSPDILQQGMRNGIILFLLAFCIPPLLPGLDTGMGLQVMITKADNASSLALGPNISVDFRLQDIELSMEAYSGVFIGSTVGMNLKVWYPLPIGFWRPRIGAGTGFALNDRIVYASSLDGLSYPPPFSWNAIVSLELFRFLFREAGISFFAVSVFTDLSGPGHEMGAAVTLFRFLSGKNNEKR